MPSSDRQNLSDKANRGLALGALGVVYGDIGTSPLYTIKTAVDWSGGSLDRGAALGMFSLIVWTLIIITSVKYVAVIMRADNEGEGGILALMVHERIVLLNVATANSPRLDSGERVMVTDLPDDFHALIIRYGFMEHPNIPAALTTEKGNCPLNFDMMNTSFFVGRLDIVPSRGSLWWQIKTHVFRFLHRNALPATEFFRIPPGRVVELGSQIEV